MKRIILVVISVLLAAATLSPAIASPMDDAVSRLHRDGERVRHHALHTIIAERDLVTSRIEAANARFAWDLALRDGNSRAAAEAAMRYHEVRDAEYAIAKRVQIVRADRDRARADFRASARDVRRLAAIAKRRARVAAR